MLVLKDGPSYPIDIHEASGMPLGTVRNTLTKLRKRRLVEYTGEVHPDTKAKRVRLTADGFAIIGVTEPIGSCDAVTPEEGSSLASVYVNDHGEAEF